MHINRFSRNLAAIFAVSAMAVVAAGGSVASAKTIKSYKHVCKGQVVGQSSSAGKCTGSLGKATFKTSIAVPNATTVYKAKGGTITFKLKIELKHGQVTGTWKVTKGTGKYKRAKGKGTGVSVLDPKTSISTVTYKGKLSY